MLKTDLKLWKEYIAEIAKHNKELDEQDDKIWADHIKFLEVEKAKYEVRLEEWQKRENERNAEIEKWRASSFLNKMFSVEPYHFYWSDPMPMNYSVFCMPLTGYGRRRPNYEEFLTWCLEQDMKDAK